jgi:membrane fusion protein, multidrug efflux system
VRKSLLVAGAVLICAAAAAVFWQTHAKETAAADQKSAANNAIPVLAATAKTQDVPIILRGLGTVQAFNTVSVKSRVEGAITKIDFTEGQEVHTGDILAELDVRPYQAVLDQAKAQLARDQALLANDQTNLERYAKLLTQNFAPEQQYANQKAAVTQDEATIKNNQAAIEAAQLNVEYGSIKSPIDGVTGIRQVDLGNLVQANAQTIVVVTQIKPIYVIFTLPEADISPIRDQMANGKLSVFAFSADDEKQISAGALNLIDNAVDQTTGTFKLKAEFANGDAALWPGEFVNTHLVLKDVKNGVTVPSAAIQTGPKGSFAYVVKEDSTVDMRPVTVLQTENNTSLVGSGLRAGDRVVTAGQFKLQQGSKVQVAENLANAVSSGGSDTPPGIDSSQ